MKPIIQALQQKVIFKKYKKIILTLLFNILSFAIYACPVCERNQPKLLKGVVHGKGPDSNWDYVSIWITIIISLVALFYSIKWLLKPNEKNTGHIKYFILNN